jgi:hypothetical protein
MFRIQVRTIQDSTLTYTVQSYTIEEGDFVKFYDEKYKEYKLFHASRCEIKEINEDNNTPLPTKKDGGWEK